MVSNNKKKFEARTGQHINAATAASHTKRAIERGRRTAAERLLGAARQQRDEAIEQQKKAEKEASEKMRKCEGHVNLVRDLTCEKEAELRHETARRMKAEGEILRAERDKERAIQKQREAEEKSRKIKQELRSLHEEKQKLAKKYQQLCRATGFPNNPEVEGEEGSIRCLEDELQLERFRITRLERRVAVLQPRVDHLKKANATAKKKAARYQRAAALLKEKRNGCDDGEGDGVL